MPNDHVISCDEPSVIAAAVRSLAVDAHALLATAGAGGSGRPDEVLAALQLQAGDLLGRVGEDRLDDLRRWLEALQRQVFIRQWLSDSLDDRREIRRRGQARIRSNEWAACPAA